MTQQQLLNDQTGLDRFAHHPGDRALGVDGGGRAHGTPEVPEERGVRPRAHSASTSWKLR